MTGITYIRLINQAMDLYKQGDYASAYNLITKKGPEVNGIEAQIYNFRYSLACKMGRNDLALRIMEEAIVDKGYWYSYDYFIADDDLKPLHGSKDFDKFAGMCKDRELEAKKSSKPGLKVIMPNIHVQDKCPMMIVLHGNQENIRITEPYWEACLSSKYLLALPESSQIEFSDAYAWNDVEKGANELKAHYEKILQYYNIDADNIVIGGFSAGCRVALYAMLHDLIDVKRFIFVGPWLPEIDEWKDALEKLKIKGITGHVFCGDKDDDCLELTKKFVGALKDRQIPNVFTTIEGLSHDYPENFCVELKNIIAINE